MGIVVNNDEAQSHCMKVADVSHDDPIIEALSAASQGMSDGRIFGLFVTERPVK